MIKKILKKVFPVAFLKQCFLVYNKIKIGTIDKIIYPEYRVPKTDFMTYREDYPFRINQIDISLLQDRPEFPFMKDWMNWTQEEFLLELKTECWIEPEYGWAIIPPNKLVYESLAFSRTAHQRKPDLIRFFSRKETLTLEKAISLRDGGEENYFHFYNDVLSKIHFLLIQKIALKEYSVIVSKRLWDKAYFQYYLSHSELLGSLTWIVQDKKYICCKSVIFCKPMTHTVNLWKAVILPSPTAVTQNRKLFLTRNKNRLRFIENAEEIESVCKRYGMEIVDADGLPFEKQVELFSQASFIAGVHGAGLTNMVYRNSNCRILEVFPPPDAGYLPYHYILLAGMKGFPYRAIIGERGRISYSGGFHLDADRFEIELKEFL